MSKIGALNIEVEEYINFSISKGNSFDKLVENVQSLFRLSDGESERIVWELWQGAGCNNLEPNDYDGQPDEAQEWADFDPDC